MFVVNPSSAPPDIKSGFSHVFDNQKPVTDL